MIPSLTSTGAIHAVLAGSCIVLGLIQLLAAKGGVGHRARGYAFVYGMLTADAAALLVYRFTGHFNILHVGAIANFACVLLAMVPLLRSPRPANWMVWHYTFIAWSYVGLLAAAATELIVRVIQPPTRADAWGLTGATTALVTVLGYVLIHRNRPPGASRARALHDGAQGNGVVL
ncbi:hypothetical protein [Bradyrhizobium sp.]|uniref:hypothetical protein n=1 Tax=Bradyrhizobium sp. TaxID=376 RepID=UPI0039E6E8DD